MHASKLNPILVWLAAACAALLLAGCGGGGGGAPAAEVKNTLVIGKLAMPPAAKDVAMRPLAEDDPIEVYVEEDPAIRTEVGEDLTFTLRGLPAGSITLVFVQGETELGRLVFDEVAANQQITITVQLVDEEVVLVDEDRRGIGHAGVELQGLVENVIAVDPAADSRFVIAGRSVVARPGVTAIREGITRRTVADVTVGRQVHVKGTTVVDSTDVLAFEIKLQTPATEEGEGAGGEEQKMTICHIPPGNPSKAKTISIGVSAWPAHKAHGDTEGEC